MPVSFFEFVSDEVVKKLDEVAFRIRDTHGTRRRDLELACPTGDEALEIVEGVEVRVFRFDALLNALLEGVEPYLVVSFATEEPADSAVAAGRTRMFFFRK